MSSRCQLLFPTRSTDWGLGIVAGCSSINFPVALDQFRPDGFPVIRAKHLTRNFTFGERLNARTMLNGYFASRRYPLMDGTFGYAEMLGQRLVTSSDASGDLNWVFVHCLGSS